MQSSETTIQYNALYVECLNRDMVKIIIKQKKTLKVKVISEKRVIGWEIILNTLKLNKSTQYKTGFFPELLNVISFSNKVLGNLPSDPISDI